MEESPKVFRTDKVKFAKIGEGDKVHYELILVGDGEDSRSMITIPQSSVESFTHTVVSGWDLSYSSRVRRFTETGSGELPKKPVVMNKEQVTFIIDMILSELGELACTVMPTSEVLEFMRSRVGAKDFNASYVAPESEVETIAEQMDALGDLIYYAENAAAKQGVNLYEIRNLIQAANMDKFRNGVIRRPDGKIMKPEDWKEPDIVGEIKKQMS